MLPYSLFGFKISYCMGMREDQLLKIYPEIMKAATDIGYLETLKVANQCRYYTTKYFKTIARSVKDDEVLLSRLEQVNTIAVKQRALVEDLYKELETNLPYNVFVLVFALSTLTKEEYRELSCILKGYSPERRFYFMSCRTLNLHPYDFLTSDLVLLRKLRPYNNGVSLDILKDSSSLSKELQKLVSKSFMSVKDLEEYSTILVDETSEDFKGFKVPELEKKLLYLPKEIPAYSLMFKEGESAIIASRDFDRYSDSGNLPVVLLMPVQKDLYNEVLKRTYPNVYIFSDQ